MLNVKKTALAAAVLLSVGTGAAEAYPIVTFGFNGTFSMYSTTGVYWGGDPAVTGSMTMDMGTGSGSATIAASTVFSGYMWTAHAITLTAMGPGLVQANMLFDWNGNLDIPVVVDFSMTPTAWVTDPNVDAYQFAIATLDGNGDGIPGYPMATPPFQGFNATFGGTATVTNVDTGQVPVPAAVWLFGSGLLGLVGVSRRRKKA